SVRLERLSPQLGGDDEVLAVVNHLGVSQALGVACGFVFTPQNGQWPWVRFFSTLAERLCFFLQRLPFLALGLGELFARFGVAERPPRCLARNASVTA